MKQLKLLFTFLFLAVLGLGNVWGEDVEISYANFSNTSYNTSESTFTTGDFTFGYVNAMKNGANGTPTGWAKNQVIQTKSGSTIYNKTELGKITNIRVYLVVNNNAFTITSGETSNNLNHTTSKPNNPSGTENITYTAYANKTTTEGQSGTSNYYDIDLSQYSDKFFKLTSGGSNYIYKLIITYTTGGSTETAVYLYPFFT